MSEGTTAISVVNRDRHLKVCRPRLLFVGDCFRTKSVTNSITSSPLSGVIKSADLSVVNLEGPIASGPSITKNGPHVSLSDQFPTHLAAAGFDVACLANNHVMDYGYKSVQHTKTACEDVELQTLGTGEEYSDAIEPIHRTIDGTEIALFNACQKEFGTASNHEPGTAWIGTPGLVQKLNESADKSDIVIVVAHGGSEHVPLPPPAWRDRLLELVDAGADLIVGHHPHVVQGWEMVNQTPIIYSLGNFVAPTNRHSGTTWGAVLSCGIVKDEIAEAKLLLTRNHSTHASIIEQPALLDKHRVYLTNASNVTAQLSKDPGYWQALACTLYDLKYQPLLDRFGGGHVRTTFTNPTTEIRRLRKRVLDPRKIRQQDRLKLLNYLRAEGHRNVMETALSIKTGTTDDLRTADHHSTVEDLLDHISEI